MSNLIRTSLVGLCVAAFLGTDGDIAVAEERKPVMLLMHPGAFAFGDPSLESRAVLEAERAGFRPVNIAYVLSNVPKAVKQVKRIARRYRQAGRKVYAYGESAGGTLASLLAERGLVRRAAAYAPVSNLLRWNDFILAFVRLTRDQAARFSPALHSSPRPILVLVPEQDAPTTSSDTRGWAHREALVSARTVPGGHEFIGGEDYAGNLRIAMNYLSRDAR